MADFTLVTYGGGDILYNVFNGIAMLFHGNNSIIQPLAIITASIGGIIAITKAFFTPPEGFITKYLLPLLALPFLLLTLTTTVTIDDMLDATKTKQVKNVPFLLGKLAEVVSTLGYKTTVAIETVMHVPSDQSYNKTGMVFGADTALNIAKYKINNGDLERNLKRFAKQCVLYDIALNKYSINDLKKTTDLWGFLKSHTSNVRMINYVDPSAKGSSGTYVTCSDALTKMTPLFELEKTYYAKEDIVKNLPLTYQSLTGLQAQQSDLISQQLMMNLLSNEYSGSNFATAKAQAQQKSTYLVLGSLASNTLVTMRAVFEVLIYVSFIFVLPLSLLPGGIKFISTWVWLTVWVQLWPPFYAILNYIMQTVATGKAAAIFTGLSEADKGLSFFTSAGLAALNDDIFALSGYLAASVPFISYAVVQGGINSFIHLAGSMMTPAHAAATSAAGEQISGNYSLANSSFGQMSYENSSMLQKNLAPSLSSGYVTENSGSQSMIHASDETIVKQANSDLRTSIFSDASISQSLQNSYQHAETAMESKQQTYMESLSNHSRNMSDLTEHIGKSQNFSENLSSREAYDAHESARYLVNVAENFGHSHNLNARDGLSVLAGVSGGISAGFSKTPVSAFISGDGRASYDTAASRDDLYNAALNIATSEDFQRNFQKVQDFSINSSSSMLDDEGLRLVQGVTKSLDEVASSQEQYMTSLSAMNQISESLSWTQNNAQSLKHSLNQDFINWASEKFYADGGLNHAMEIISGDNVFERDSLVNEFIACQRNSSDMSLNSFVTPQDSFSNSEIQSIDKAKELQALNDYTSTNKHSSGLSGNRIATQTEVLNAQIGAARESTQDHFTYSRDEMSSHSSTMRHQFDTKNQQWAAGRLMDGPDKSANLGNKFRISDQPFWMEEND